MLRTLFLTFLTACAAVAAEAAKPNIILILVDDMGWGDTSLNTPKNQQPQIATPKLAEMAQMGVQLRRHYTAAPVCAPARASLFSGVHQGHAEVIRNNNFDAALENSHTLASVLRAAGYSTALIGKWGIGGGKESGGTPTTCGAWPTDRGFDYFFGYVNHIAGHRHYPKEEAGVDPDVGGNAIWDGDRNITADLDACYSTDLFTARAKKWIVDTRKAAPDKPFFLALTLIAPHARLALPSTPYPKGGGLKGGVQWLGTPHHMINTAEGNWDSYVEPAYNDKAMKKWEGPINKRLGGAAGNAFNAAPRHATMITRVDQAVGDIMKLCRDLKIDQNTFIVFTSDNGPHDEPGAVSPVAGHPAPAQNPAFFRSYGPFDGIKRDILEGGMRVPCIVWGPGLIKKGAVSNEPGQFQDWMATFAELAGVPKPMRCDGVSLLPVLQGKKDSRPGHVVYSEYFFPGNTPQYPDFIEGRNKRPRGEQQMILFRDDKGRMLKAERSAMRTGDEDFAIYDVEADTHEARDLAPQMPEMQQKLKTMALYNRRAYDYVRDPACGRRNNPCQAARPYDGHPVPAESIGDTKQGWTKRQVQAATPWVPEFDTLPQAAEAAPTLAASPLSEELPAGSVTEYHGYLNIPADGTWRFFLTLPPTEGSRAYVRMHRFQLIDADASAAPGSVISSSSAENTVEAKPETGNKGIPLKAGLHEITFTVVQGPSAPGKVQFAWQQSDGPVQPVPADACVSRP